MAVPSCSFLSATAGLAGSLASVSAKFAFGDLPLSLDVEPSILPFPAPVVSVAFRGVFILGTILLNGIMWAFYMKALRVSGNTLQALAINTACNFVSSAVFGYLFFGDLITGSWMFGAALMLVGVILMNIGDSVLSREQPDLAGGALTSTKVERDPKKIS
ncbi:hypothetical protein BV898_02599 [Hypsibius exemplaris]|uniref:EamA domain-containing protein n=1 Tax=Hypsibius exemplaris TaxID=2072580 RepID=A0A1W0X7G8_HYPEX|nr:hypothetical protein BV898_02599 [Hypsibius exemplaris]